MEVEGSPEPEGEDRGGGKKGEGSRAKSCESCFLRAVFSLFPLGGCSCFF
jgi:hypothetical protein